MVGRGAYTEFYVQTTGANTNSGHTTDNGPTYTSVNGNWDGTSVFTPVDGSTPASTVTNGAWASVYNDGVNPTVYIALVTNVAAGANGAITLDRAAFSGTAPTTSATGRTINIGGAWKGPNATVAFPFGFLAATATNGNFYFPRCNLKNSGTYSITATMTHNKNGPAFFQGYTSSPGDLGKATIDGGDPATSFVLLTLSGNNVCLIDLVFANNGHGGSAAGLAVTGTEEMLMRCVAHNTYRSGFSLSTISTVVECEAYACNTSNTANESGFTATGAGAFYVRCISHDNTGGNTHGFYMGGACQLVRCIADSNGKNGFNINVSTALMMIGCDAYNNGVSGLEMQSATETHAYIENCNFIKNASFGIASTTSSQRNGAVVNCGFGSGTQTNANGNIAATVSLPISGTVTYPTDTTPWVDPANGDFRINLAAAKSAGRGVFTETAASYAGTVGYPDIGAAQSASTNSSSGGSWTFSQ